MKLHFEPNLDFQHRAIDAVVGVFAGQEILRSEFTVEKPRSTPGQGLLTGMVDSGIGVGNLSNTLLPEQIRDNLQRVQLKNGLKPAAEIILDDLNITIEMETGTGKTYVYLRTVFELNRQYGFTKFIVVVPSVAIREGVHKTLQMTEEHFRGLYAGVPIKSFVYDSTKPGQIRDFATSADIRVMVITAGAFRSESFNLMHKSTEKLNDDKPIDLIAGTRPILIVDEPQSVDGGDNGKGRAAMKLMKPLCTLRYSATHVDAHEMVYRLDAIDAYERKLVKQIEIAGLTVQDANNKPYVKFIASKQTKTSVTATVELDVLVGGKLRRKEVPVRDGDDLAQTTKRELYAELRIGEIRGGKGNQLLEVKLPNSEPVFLRPGEAVNGVDLAQLQRQMIRRTILEHLQKEKVLNKRGIKVLSLFFIEQVGDYRRYDDAGTAVRGPVAVMFEEEFKRLAKHPDFAALFKERNIDGDAAAAHDGYFSIDKKNNRWADTDEGNAGGRDAAERAYDLIMKDKEKLLSLDTPLKFIFSHSALREGWDNPNVFQICVLRDISTLRERRQTIGRGLRLCVNQQGQRVRDDGVNVLTVIANESYEEFAEKLQEEIEADTSIRFGVVEEHQFAGVPHIDEHGAPAPLGLAQSQALFAFLKSEKLVDSHGKIDDALRFQLRHNQFKVPEQFDRVQEQVVGILTKLAGKLDIKNAYDDRKAIGTRQVVLEDEAFLALWERIKSKTTYRVAFDNQKLIDECVKGLKLAPPVPRAHIDVAKADVRIDRGGVDTHNVTTAAAAAIDDSGPLPDILTELERRTGLTRKSLARILIDSDRLDDFKANPARFVAIAGEAIDRCKRLAVVDGIKYEKVGDSAWHVQELFVIDELKAHLASCVAATKAVHEWVKVDSNVERTFVEDLEKNSAVKLYAKLPRQFVVHTPLGTYNPDWAIVINTNGTEQLYFVVETKGSSFGDDLRHKERAKIECGKAHFKALSSEHENPAVFAWGKTLEQLMSTHVLGSEK